MDNWFIYIWPFIGGSVSAYIIFILNYRRTKMEKLWDMRVNSYKSVFSIIAELKYILGRWIDSSLQLIELSDSERKALSNNHNTLIKQFATFADEEILFISKNAQDIIEKCVKDYYDYNDCPNPNEAYERCYGIVDRAQKELTIEAQKDLEFTKRPFLNIFKRAIK